MDVFNILAKYFDTTSEAFYVLMQHSLSVCKKALHIANRVNHLRPNIQFIMEASLLHDIGICYTYAPKIGCKGSYPYIAHGYLGRQILDSEGFHLHGLLCERHVGVGISLQDIEAKGFPLPPRDMIPQSLEERIVCYADKFFTKRLDRIDLEMSAQEVRDIIRSYGEEKLRIFDEMHRLFSGSQ